MDSKHIEWRGGECPVSRGTAVEVVLGAGDCEVGFAADYRWHWVMDGRGGDIVGYRVIEPTLASAEAAHDPVEHPKHYTSHPSGIECIQITEHMGFNLGNAVKYIWRADLKHDDALEDLRKAKWYIEREIAKRGGSGPI